MSFWRTTLSNCTLRRGGPFGSGGGGGAASALPVFSAFPPLASPFSPLACFWPFSPPSGLPPPSALAAFGAFAALGSPSVLSGLSGFLPFLSFSLSWSDIDLCSRTLGKAQLAAVARELETDSRRLAVLGIGNGDIRQMHRQLLGDDAALRARALALVAFDHVDAAHERARLGDPHLDHLADAALVAAGQHHDLVALADLRGHHSTSGASEMIFMWFLARNSRGTGPKMRVPTGSFCGVISTAALRSKRMIEPSARLMSLEMRTMTAFITSPFLTRPRGIASFTETTMTSPIVAYLRFEPPSTLMHMTRRAPELSATSRLDCIWIMGYPTLA